MSTSGIETIIHGLPAIAADVAVEVEARTAWLPVNLDPVLDGVYEAPLPTVARFKGDAAGLFYRGAVNGIHGDSGIGKSWVVQAAAAQELADGNTVIVIDYESSAAEYIARLRALGVDIEAIRERLLYYRPDEMPGVLEIDALVDLVTARNITLAAVDSVGEAFAVEGINEAADVEVGPWFRRLPRRFADAGAAVALIDHSTKAADNPLHPSGSKRKRAAITGASWLVEVLKAPTRDTPGKLVLTCAKDRHGNYQRGAKAAHVEVTPYPDDGVTVNLWPVAVDDDPGDVLYIIARALVRHLADAGRPMSRNELETAGVVKARAARIRGALDRAEGLGAVTVQRGPRGAHLYAYQKELEAPE